jgi:hypothetical protein
MSTLTHFYSVDSLPSVSVEIPGRAEVKKGKDERKVITKDLPKDSSRNRYDSSKSMRPFSFKPIHCFSSRPKKQASDENPSITVDESGRCETIDFPSSIIWNNNEKLVRY